MKPIFVLLIVLTASVTSFGQTQLEMNQQAAKEHKKADAEMTALYKKALAKLATDATQKQLLIDAQRAWIKYKEAHCKAEAAVFEGGSMQPLIYSSCLTELTNERSKQLRKYFQYD